MPSIKLTICAIALALAVPTLNATTIGENPVLDRSFNDARLIIDSAMRQDQLSRAEEIIDGILAIDPDYAPAYVEQVRIWLKQPRSVMQSFFQEKGTTLDRAVIGNFERAIALEPGYADAYVLYGFIETNRRPHLALALLDEAARLGTSNPWLGINRAAVLERLGRTDEAFTGYLAELSNVSNHGQAQKIIEGLLRTAHTLPGQVKAHFAWFKRDPDSLEAFVSFIQAMWEYGDLAEAASVIADARRAHPDEPWFASADAINAYALAGRTSSQDGATAEARRQLDTAKATGFPPQHVLPSLQVFGNWASVAAGLSRLGLDINQRDAEGASLLDRVIGDASPSDLKLMIAHGAEIDGCRCGVNLPVFTVIDHDRSDLFEVLVSAGVDLSVQDRSGRTVSTAVRDAHNPEIVELFASEQSTDALDELAAGQFEHGLRTGDTSIIVAAVRYLESRKQPDSMVIGLLQAAMVEHPRKVVSTVPARSAAFDAMCGSARSAGDEPISIERRRLALEQLGPAETDKTAACRRYLLKAAEHPRMASRGLSATEVAQALEHARISIDNGSRGAGQIETAARPLEKVLKWDADHAEARLLSGRLHLSRMQGDYFGDESHRFKASAVKLASDDLEAALAKRFDETKAYAFYCIAMVRDGRPAAAATLLRSGRSRQSPSGWLNVCAAELALLSGDNDTAIGTLGTLDVDEQPPALSVEAGLLTAEALIRKGDLNAGMAKLAELHHRRPNDAFIARTYGEYLLEKQAAFAEASAIGAELSKRGRTESDRVFHVLAQLADGARKLTGDNSVREGTAQIKAVMANDTYYSSAVVAAAAYPSAHHVFRALHDSGLDPNPTDRNGRSPLIAAVEAGDRDLVNELLEFGSSVEPATPSAKSILQIAIERQHEGIAYELIASGVDVSRQFKHGVSPGDFAMNRNMPNIADTIRLAQSGTFPDWETQSSGAIAGKAQPLGVMLVYISQPEAAEVFWEALRNNPVSALRRASAFGLVEKVCPAEGASPMTVTPEDLATVESALAAAKRRQLTYGLSSDTVALDACLAFVQRGQQG